MPSKNYNDGKFRPTLVIQDMWQAFRELVEVREQGAQKYDRMNWAESIGTSDAPRFLDENIDSIFRHLLAYMGGEQNDPESGCHHMAHVMCRAAFSVEYDKAEPDNPLDSGDFIPKPTYREILKRGNEMQAWLIELITERHDVGALFPNARVDILINWDDTPEGEEFWRDVYYWQQGVGRHPAQPMK